MHVFCMISHRNSWSRGLETRRATLPQANTSRPAGIRRVRGVSECVWVCECSPHCRMGVRRGGVGCTVSSKSLHAPVVWWCNSAFVLDARNQLIVRKRIPSISKVVSGRLNSTWNLSGIFKQTRGQQMFCKSAKNTGTLRITAILLLNQAQTSQKKKKRHQTSHSKCSAPVWVAHNVQ